jgi:hypothetical protein
MTVSRHRLLAIIAWFFSTGVFLLVTVPDALAGFRALEDSSRVQVDPVVLQPGGTALITYHVSEPAEKSLSLHYGFNGWNHVTAGIGAGRESIDGNTNYFIRRPMTYNAQARQYQLEIEIPATARALHFVFCRDACGPGTWDNNNDNDYARPVVFPYIGPILTWDSPDASATSMVVSFEHPVAGDGWLNYWEGNRASTKISSLVRGPMHRFLLRNLKPNTRYYYQVGVGSEYRSKTFSFRTTGPSSGMHALSFLVFGDAQDNGEDGIFSRVAAAMAANHGDVDFVISTGDMPWNDKPGDWWSFFDRGRELFAAKVLMPALGNHDTPTVTSNGNHVSFNYYFQHPGQSAGVSHYRFNVGPAAFFAMNSERPSELAENGAQYRWLQSQLASRTQGQQQPGRGYLPNWSFAYWHIPPFNAGSRHWRSQNQFRAPPKMFNRVLDWHFGGHEHLYQRMRPIEAGSQGPVCGEAYGPGPGEGVGYLVVPSGGVFPNANLVPRSQNPEARSLLAFPDVATTVDAVPAFSGFTRVDIDGPAISIRTYNVTLSGRFTLVDEVSYTK